IEIVAKVHTLHCRFANPGRWHNVRRDIKTKSFDTLAGPSYCPSVRVRRVQAQPELERSMDVELLDQSALTTERPSAVGLVTTYIRQAMRDGRLVPGQRLVEPDLIAALGVSRGTVR